MKELTQICGNCGLQKSEHEGTGFNLCPKPFGGTFHSAIDFRPIAQLLANKTELNEQDRERIEQQADIIYDNSPDVLDAYDIVLRLMMELATYEHNYQRGQQAKRMEELKQEVEFQKLRANTNAIAFNDKQRIDRLAHEYSMNIDSLCSYKDGYTDATLYERHECDKIIERATADGMDTIVMLDQKVKSLEAERSEVVKALKGIEPFCDEVIARQVNEPVFGYNGQTLTLSQLKAIKAALNSLKTK